VSEIKIVRLITQEDIICKYEYNEDNNTHLLKNPCILIITPQGYGAMPWLPYAKTNEGVLIRNDQVMVVLEAEKEVSDEYDSKFGGGTVLVPEKSKLVTVSGPTLRLNNLDDKDGPLGLAK